MPVCSASTVAAIASFSVEAAGKRASAFHAAPAAPREALDVVRRRCRRSRGRPVSACARGLGPGDPSTTRGREPRPEGRRRSSTRVDERAAARERRDAHGRRRRAGSATRSEKRRPWSGSRREPPPVRETTTRTCSRCRAARDEPVGHLVGSGLLDRWRRERGRAITANDRASRPTCRRTRQRV